MRSPIKNLKNQTNCHKTLCELIPKGKVIDFYPMYSGEIPFKLSEKDRFVIGHTPSAVVYEFWVCALQEPDRIAEIAEAFYPNLNENTFDILKKNWYSYKDPFVRSALFFLLNRCSDLGMITHGNLDEKNYNAFALRDLKNFKIENFHLNYLRHNNFEKVNNNICLFNMGKFRNSFLENEQILGEEEVEIKQKELLKLGTDRKSIFIFNYHASLMKLNSYEKILLDTYGRITTEQHAKEIILHNVR